ncbi:ribosome biogenesis protein SLX9 homolog [Asterias amurensis]|uniref:ribosome biogenesis protein SLX9 homolog n=1 Tax=Asterias amurensis TaxID=7602 RepID=UPI003AB3A987
MGKIKTKRHKLHTPARATSARKADDESTKADLSKIKASLIPPGAEFPTRGLFHLPSTSPAGSLQTNLPQEAREDDEEDRRSFISKKSIKGQGRITKKDKMKMRHDKWLQKIETIQVAKRSAKEAKRRSERPIIGDLNPLNQALPELSEIIALSQRKTQEAQKAVDKRQHKGTLKAKERQQLLLEESSRFKQVLRHAAFKTNPFAAITQHLKNKMEQEQQDQRPGS